MGSFCTFSPLILFGFLIHCAPRSPSKEQLQPLLGKWNVFDQELLSIKEPIQRDLILIQLAVTSPRFAPELCKRTQSIGAKEKCRQVIGRPHLGIAK